MKILSPLGYCSAFALALAICEPFPATARESRAASDALPARNTVELSEGWRFKLDDGLQGAQAIDFPDGDWSTVAVPHTWNRVGYYLPQYGERINTPERTNKTQGVGWYRLSFERPKEAAGNKSWLEFDAASRIAKVWLNGVFLGEHRGGFSRFRLDATKAMRPGKNVLAVQADNSRPALGSSTADVLPLTGDFFVPGGLYRPVRLITTEPVHFDMLDAGGPGVYATTRSIVGNAATVDVALRLRNDGARREAITLTSRLVDDKGTTVATSRQRAVAPPGAMVEAAQTLHMQGARLWQGVDDPYLYRLVVEARDRRGSLLDRVEQNIGIRQTSFDPAKGFFLNGKPYKVRGVGYHQDREDKAWAITPEDVAEDVRILREMGATSIRLTHYQHGQPIHDIADREGLLLWDEVPLVSSWTLGEATEASPALRDNARQQLTELIRQNQNHPSSIVWGIANEVDFGNSLPVFLTGSSKTPPDPLPLLNELQSHAKALDPSRPTALATCCEGRLFGSNVEVPTTAPVADLGGANRYFGWYYGKPHELTDHLANLRLKRQDQPLAITEYGAGGAVSIHTDNVLGGPVDSRGRHQPEEYESYIHEQVWGVLERQPDLWATWLWSGFDFASTVRHEGDAEDINTKGLVTYDRRIRKDAYYFYKANWSQEPTVHITGRRYMDRAYPVTDVRVYSNAALTNLTLNGESLGAKQDCPQRICVWSNVRLAEGVNSLRAFAGSDQQRVEDKVEWRLAAGHAATFRIDSGALVAGQSSAGRVGSDHFFAGGETGTVVKPAEYGRPAQPPVVAGTDDDVVAATYRHGDFSYRLPLPDGRYRVRLTFIEPSAKPGERTFDVLAGNRVRIAGLDVAKSAGSPVTALQRTFTVDARGGQLELQFASRKGAAIVSAVEVSPVGRK